MATTPSIDELIARHLDFARNTAAKTAQELPIEMEDAIQIGYEGLVQAARRFDISQFDPSRGDLDTNFKSFVYPRIRGAVIDKVRSDSFIKRRGAEKGMTAKMVSLNLHNHYEDGKEMGDPAIQIEAVSHDPDLVLDFERAIKTLTDRERRVVMALAVGAKGSELAEEFQVSESRVSQIASEARQKLVTAMRAE